MDGHGHGHGHAKRGAGGLWAVGVPGLHCVCATLQALDPGPRSAGWTGAVGCSWSVQVVPAASEAGAWNGRRGANTRGRLGHGAHGAGAHGHYQQGVGGCLSALLLSRGVSPAGSCFPACLHTLLPALDWAYTHTFIIICLGAESSQRQSPPHHTNKWMAGDNIEALRPATPVRTSCSTHAAGRALRPPRRLGAQRVHRRRLASRGRLSKQPQCRCCSLGAFARMHALKINRWRRRCGSDSCLPACLHCLHCHLQLAYMTCPVLRRVCMCVRHWSPPTYIPSQAPPWQP